MQLDYILQAFTVFADGYGKAGSGEKCNLPKIKKKTEEHRGGGMLAPRRIALGFEAFDFEADLASFDPQVLALVGLYTGAKGVAFGVRGYLDGDQNSEHTAILQMRGEVIECDPGAWEAGKKAMLKFKTALDALKLTIDGSVIWDIDIENGVYSVGGNDPYARVRAALGY
ncbi:phage major tail tube protein [Methylosinus sp. KRF6]|uniref:phage major tail tube protein n=1 Tax=Methylosinus sp. KRF6 TaxID=2846853 RepID=UPI001C0B323C|nr:phage major tail tube protein [Methylosinus sp. KRF6]MBU3890099.1 phage major tail tube protein [Methylosinus sp. KRF6]